ncbi:MAG: hypothetical protein LBO08_03135 [Rickettsiales bacterium]|jgi:hypothetical protein|nr:hypothetical protein [Rickettsiales bacterium]
MKKILFLALLVSACSGMIKNENGSENLVKLNDEPVGCQYLYKLESEVSVYDAEDAQRYLENRIADQARKGNAYWITSQRTRPNSWAVFGPERAFVLNANIYKCPDVMNIITRTEAGGADYAAPADNTTMYGSTY